MAPASRQSHGGRVVRERLHLAGGDQAVVIGVDVLPVVVGEQIVDRDVSLDRRDGVGHVDAGVGAVGLAAGERRRRRETAAVVGVGRGNGRPGQDAVDAAGVVPCRQVLEGMLAEVQRIGSDRRVQVGVGGVAVGLGQRDPVIQAEETRA